ncbi:enoyl-CoA hydratase/isomerase family protein [Metabacillus sp. RGM 3146]|uniref:enoyl-CoA hydratase/isomerase family protein n=1 Tax=Metabacillus sp. RGM 3146 TaxID=3401092 RepID=UPI003B992EB6
MGKVLVKETFNGLLEVSINRPECHNAVDFEVMDLLDDILSEAEKRKDIRGMVITGSGEKTFCSGGDLSAFRHLHHKEDAYSMLRKMGEILYKIALFPVPTVALLNGTAVGGGCEIACAADIRTAKRGVKLGFIQGNLAITTGWGGGTLLFEKLAHDQAMMMLASSKIYKAEEARELGFITHLLDENDLYDNGLSAVNGFLLDHHEVLAGYKKIKKSQLEMSGLWGRMEEEIRLCSELWEKDAHLDAVQRFLDK